MFDTLGDRMKENYEDRSRLKLTRRMPVILRVDGRAFHTVTKKLKAETPFCVKLSQNMKDAASALFKDVQGATFGYLQSDEFSIFIKDYTKLTTAAWFDYNVQKMTSIAASIMSSNFSLAVGMPVQFDARVFNIPKEEVVNYFIWRQKDWIRNSVSMLARSHFSHKELNNKTIPDMHEMLHLKGINWANCADWQKNGWYVNRSHWLDNVDFSSGRNWYQQLVDEVEE